MKVIQFTDPHRKKHFAFFRNMNHPHFNITANVDVSTLLSFSKEKNISFTPLVVYLISRIANEIPQFRWRIREEQVVEHEWVHPSFAIEPEVSDVFSFCLVEYNSHPKIFIQNALEEIEKRKQNPSFEDEPGRDDYLFLSVIPWVSFTGIQHAMSLHPCDSIPRIVWGKFFYENGKVKMPLSVQAHHAIVDGRQVGEYFQRFEETAGNIKELF